MIITSPQNPRVKLAVRLRNRRDRERERLMLVEGRNELTLALASGAQLRTLFVCPNLSAPAAGDLLKHAQSAGTEIVEVSESVFAKISYRDNPDGWLGLAPLTRRTLADLALPAVPLLLVAEAVEKPGNLGAMLRSADAAGAHGLIVCDPTTDVHNPNVVRSSRGTLFSVPVAEANGPETRAWLRQHGIAIVAATPQAATLYTAADLRGPVAVAVGAEDEGLTADWLRAADVNVRIPMTGRVNSLNVSAAATLLLYEAVRQRGGSR